MTEVGGHGEVAPLVELLAREARPRPDHAPTFDGAAEDEHGRGVAVIGAAIAVLAHGAAKFRHGQDYHLVHAIAEVPVQRGQALGELAEALGELSPLVALIGVGIPAPRVRESHLEPHVGLDELGDLLEAVAEPATRILRAVRGREALGIGRLEHLHGVEGFPTRAVQDVAHALLVERLESAPRVDPAALASHVLLHVEVRHRAHGHRAHVSAKTARELGAHGHRAER